MRLKLQKVLTMILILACSCLFGCGGEFDGPDTDLPTNSFEKVAGGAEEMEHYPHDDGSAQRKRE